MAFARTLLAAALLTLGAQGASAATIVVDYDLTGSTLTVTDPVTVAVPADQVSGSLTLAFEADDLGNILMDAASQVTLVAFDVLLDLDLNVFGILPITGQVTISLLAPVAGGSLASDGTVSFAAAPAAEIYTSGVLDCGASAFLCGLANLTAGANVIDELIVQTFPDLLLSNVLPFDPALLHQIAGSMDVTAPVTGTFDLLGAEAGRLFQPSAVPEPGPTLLLAAGLAGLAIFGAPRRREARLQGGS